MVHSWWLYLIDLCQVYHDVCNQHIYPSSINHDQNNWYHAPMQYRSIQCFAIYSWNQPNVCDMMKKKEETMTVIKINIVRARIQMKNEKCTSKRRYCPSLWFDLLNGQAVLHSLYYTNALHPPCYSLPNGFSFWKLMKIQQQNRIQKFWSKMDSGLKVVLFIQLRMFTFTEYIEWNIHQFCGV